MFKNEVELEIRIEALEKQVEWLQDELEEIRRENNHVDVDLHSLTLFSRSDEVEDEEV